MPLRRARMSRRGQSLGPLQQRLRSPHGAGGGVGCWGGRGSGTPEPEGRGKGHGPRPLRPSRGAGCPEGRRPPLAHQPGVCLPPSTPRERPRGGRGGADRGQAQGEDERGAGQTTRPLTWESIHNRAYLSIGVTNPSGPGLCGVPGEGDSRGIGVGLCRILDMNFREFLFHALRCIRAKRRAGATMHRPF
jgi:hypothetical protein